MTTLPQDDFSALVGTISDAVRRERVDIVAADAARGGARAHQERVTRWIAVGLTVAAVVLLALRWDAIVNPRTDVTDLEIDRAVRARVAEVAARVEGELAATGRLPASLEALDMVDASLAYAPEPDGHYTVSAFGPSGLVRFRSGDDLSALFPARGAPASAPPHATPAPRTPAPATLATPATASTP